MNVAIVDGLGIVYCALQRGQRLDIPMSVYESVHMSLSIRSSWAAVYRVKIVGQPLHLQSVLWDGKYKDILNTDNIAVPCLYALHACKGQKQTGRECASKASPMRQFANVISHDTYVIVITIQPIAIMPSSLLFLRLCLYILSITFCTV